MAVQTHLVERVDFVNRVEGVVGRQQLASLHAKGERDDERLARHTLKEAQQFVQFMRRQEVPEFDLAAQCAGGGGSSGAAEPFPPAEEMTV